MTSLFHSASQPPDDATVDKGHGRLEVREIRVSTELHQGTEPLHLLHLFAHQSGVVLDQVSVGTAKAEMIGAKTWIQEMASVFPGLTVLTADALYADRDLCATIVAQDYAYLLKLKKTRGPSSAT